MVKNYLPHIAITVPGSNNLLKLRKWANGQVRQKAIASEPGRSVVETRFSILREDKILRKVETTHKRGSGICCRGNHEQMPIGY